MAIFKETFFVLFQYFFFCYVFLMFWHTRNVEYGFQPASLVEEVYLRPETSIGKGLKETLKKIFSSLYSLLEWIHTVDQKWNEDRNLQFLPILMLNFNTVNRLPRKSFIYQNVCVTVIYLGVYGLSYQFWYMGAQQLLSFLMFVSCIRFQTNLRFTSKSTDSACKKISEWSSWHDWLSFCILPQYSEMLEMDLVKLLDNFVAFCSPNILNWNCLLECINRYT